MSNIAKQTITLTNFPIFTKKGNKNHEKVRELYDACLTYGDYRLVLELLAKGKATADTDIDIENFVHRIGKHLDIKFEQELKPEEVAE